MVVGGWDISKMDLHTAMRRSKVYEPELQEKLRPHMEGIVPLPAPYYPDFIAANQEERADNVLPGSKSDHVAAIRKHIRDFKAEHSLDKVVVMWSGNTERFCDVRDGLNQTKEQLMDSITADEEEVAPSQVRSLTAVPVPTRRFSVCIICVGGVGVDYFMMMACR